LLEGRHPLDGGLGLLEQPHDLVAHLRRHVARVEPAGDAAVPLFPGGQHLLRAHPRASFPAPVPAGSPAPTEKSSCMRSWLLRMRSRSSSTTSRPSSRTIPRMNSAARPFTYCGGGVTAVS